MVPAAKRSIPDQVSELAASKRTRRDRHPTPLDAKDVKANPIMTQHSRLSSDHTFASTLFKPLTIVTPTVKPKTHGDVFRELQGVSSSEKNDVPPLTLNRAVTMDENPSETNNEESNDPLNFPRFTLRMRSTYSNPFQDDDETCFVGEESSTNNFVRPIPLLVMTRDSPTLNTEASILESPRVSLLPQLSTPPRIQRNNGVEWIFCVKAEPLSEDLMLPALA